MYTVSAADAISLAVQRTKMFLFRPFRWSTFLKLCLVALVTEGIGGNSNFSGHGGHGGSHAPTVGSAPFSFTPGWIAAIAAGAVAFLVLGLVLYYLVTRLRFAYFHCLIHNTKEIAPGWRLYRTQAMRFFWLNLAVAFCFVLVILAIASMYGAGIWRLFRDSQAGGHLDIGLLLTLILPLIPIILLLALVAFAADVILRDWMLPHYALDNATAGSAWAAVRARIQAEKGAFFGYALLRVILPIVAVLALMIVLFLPTVLFVGGAAIAELGIHVAFSSATGPAAVMGIVLQAVIGVVAFAVAFLVGLCLGGPLNTGLREYALVFYGGRYQTLGDIMFPPTLGGANAPGTA